MLRQDKILVEIIGGAFPKKRKCLVLGNTIILRPAKEGRGGAAITAEYDTDCLIPYYGGIWPFRSIRYKLLLKEGAAKCVSFKTNPVEVPSCSRNDVVKYGNATVIKLAGALKPPFNINFVYVLLIIGLILTGISILVGSGNIQF